MRAWAVFESDDLNEWGLVYDVYSTKESALRSVDMYRRLEPLEEGVELLVDYADGVCDDRWFRVANISITKKGIIVRGGHIR